MNHEQSVAEIELDDHLGRIRIRDPRLFQADHRGFARRLAEALCAGPGVKKAEIDLESAACRVDFEPEFQTKTIMADLFAGAVEAASQGGGPAWWKPRPRWSTLTAYQSGRGVSIWETHPDAPGRARLLHSGPPGARGARARLAQGLEGVDGVERDYTSPWSRWITVVGRPDDALTAPRAVDRLEGLLEGTIAPQRHPAGVSTEVVVGWSRLGYLALAAGAFTLTAVGLITPGIPTVPFLLATSYYLARSSPRLNERLHRTAFIGEILEEWEAHSAFSQKSKNKLIGLTVAIVAATLLVGPMSPIAVVVILIIASLSVHGILRTPSLKAEAPPAAGAVALPAV